MDETEFKAALAAFNSETEEQTIKRLLETNNELFESMVELYQFIEEQGLTEKDFRSWKKEKFERNYH